MYRPLALSQSPIYRGFRLLEENAFRAKVHYFEKHETAIRQLDFDDFFEILLAYSQALHHSENYFRHLTITDEIINISLSQNIISFQGEDVLQSALAEKSKSLFKINDFDAAIYVTTENLKLNPFDDANIVFLRKCFWAKIPSYLPKMKALSIASFLLCALVIAIEFIVIRTLFEQYTTIVENTRNIIFLLGIFMLLAGYSLHLFQTFKATRKTVAAAKIKFLYGK